MVIKIWRLFVILIGLFCAHVGDNYDPNTWNILAHDVNEYYCALFADCFITKLGSLLLVQHALYQSVTKVTILTRSCYRVCIKLIG